MSPKNTVFGQCRCCLSKGHHQDFTKEFCVNGIIESYCDIFYKCFNVFLSTNKEITTLICTSCIKQLQDANSFKAKALESEQKLLDMLSNKQTIFVNVPSVDISADTYTDSKQDLEIKTESSDLDAGDSTEAVEIDAFDSDLEKSMDNGHKESYDDLEAKIMSRFSSSDLKMLPTRETLKGTCGNYLRHLESLQGKYIDAKFIIRLMEEYKDCKRMENSNLCSQKNYISEKTAHIDNALLILENSNVSPFKGKGRHGFPCFYCRNTFENITILRRHQTNEHTISDIKRILNTYGAEVLVVYVDVTDLKCNICNANASNLNELKSHLVKVHKKSFHAEFADRVIPYKLSDNNIYQCQVCGFDFETFGCVERHMNVHYRNYVCKECGSGFVTKYRLKVHSKSMHVDGSFPCDVCKKVFSTPQKLKMHFSTVHNALKRFKCPRCSERFTEYFKRQKHMVAVHGEAPLVYKCNVCEKSFDRRYTLSRHLKRDHLEERDYKCEICLYRCFTKNELTVHMIKHNGQRIHECSVCKKSYARKKTLTEHMRIHNNDRRFACAVCGQAFVQKCSLKGHIKTHHLDYSFQ